MKLIHGDCLEQMAHMEANSIDFIVTDPPYGLHFMGKSWDSKVSDWGIWLQALRICKPGTWLAAFGASRKHHLLMTALETAGWEIRDVIMWLFGSGFPKSFNNFGLKGYGTALKPAYEPIILAMKPLDGTFSENAVKWGIAGLNIDDSRIATNELKPYSPGLHINSPTTFNDDNWKGKDQLKQAPNGRWPANLILDEQAAEQLDLFTGILKSPGSGVRRKNAKNSWKNSCDEIIPNNYLPPDSGGASRFFYCAKASIRERNAGLEGMPLKDAGFKNSSGRGIQRGDAYTEIKRQNNHPTVKPIALMKYIVKLLAPPGNPICLDPFMGSGTTGIACHDLGIDFIGIEKETEYFEIAKNRIENTNT